jgi:hypothetical protein
MKETLDRTHHAARMIAAHPSATISALLSLLIFGITDAKAVKPDDLPRVACSELHFSAAFLAKYPAAPAACLEARVKDGKRYAKFNAKVYISDPAFMTVELLDVAGNSVTTFSFKPSPHTRFLKDGKAVKYTAFRRGETLTIWVPEDRLGVYALPDSTAEAWSVLPPR